MALVARPQHDIIFRPSIPLAATSDQPLAEVVRPPESASNNTDDQSSGVAKEISPEQAAELAAARKGDPATAEIDEPVEGKPAAAKTKPEAQQEEEAIKKALEIAAKKSGRSLPQEIQERIEFSFWLDRKDTRKCTGQ